jgi:hypothetical protein
MRSALPTFARKTALFWILSLAARSAVRPLVTTLASNANANSILETVRAETLAPIVKYKTITQLLQATILVVHVKWIATTVLATA